MLYFVTKRICYLFSSQYIHRQLLRLDLSSIRSVVVLDGCSQPLKFVTTLMFAQKKKELPCANVVTRLVMIFLLNVMGNSWISLLPFGPLCGPPNMIMQLIQYCVYQ
jgi:hypothetical protein